MHITNCTAFTHQYFDFALNILGCVVPMRLDGEDENVDILGPGFVTRPGVALTVVGSTVQQQNRPSSKSSIQNRVHCSHTNILSPFLSPF